jgi:hypothetical protein
MPLQWSLFLFLKRFPSRKKMLTIVSMEEKCDCNAGHQRRVNENMITMHDSGSSFFQVCPWVSHSCFVMVDLFFFSFAGKASVHLSEQT